MGSYDFDSTYSSIVSRGRRAPYSLCGRKCYMVGFQDGSFQQLGWHLVGDMGGLWIPPIKVLNGFRIGLGRGECGDLRDDIVWLENSDSFVIGDYGSWVEHRYSVEGNHTIIRREYIPFEEPVAIIEIHIKPSQEGLRYRTLYFLPEFKITPCWYCRWPEPLDMLLRLQGDALIAHSITSHGLPEEYRSWSAVLSWSESPSCMMYGDTLKELLNYRDKRSIPVLLGFKIDTSSDGIAFSISASIENWKIALENARRSLRDRRRLLEDKIQRYRYLALETTIVETPEEDLNIAFLWGKMNLEWLTRTSELGTGVVAGHPEYSWYFSNDTSISIGGLLAAGFHDTAKSALKLFKKYIIENGGRVPHEIVMNGEVYDRGRVEEVAMYTKAVWDTYLWTGDRAFLEDLYPVCRLGMLEYVAKQPRVEDMILLDLYDIRESPRGLLPPCHLIAGFKALAEMALRVGDLEAYKASLNEADILKRKLEEIFWDEAEEEYACIVENGKRIFDANVMYWPGSLDCVYHGVADPLRAVKALSKLWSDKYMSNNGPYLNIRRDTVMPVRTGMMAIGELNYGRVNEGFKLIRIIAKSFGHVMPGAFPEIIHPSGEPGRFDLRWCYLQLWSSAIYVQGLVYGLLHPIPDAEKGVVKVSPSLPREWDRAVIKNIRFGESIYDFILERVKGELSFRTVHKSGPVLKIIH